MNDKLYIFGSANTFYRLRITDIHPNGLAFYVMIEELQFYWNGAWQTNAMTSDTTGTIGGIPCTTFASSTDGTNGAREAFDGLLWNYSGQIAHSWVSSSSFLSGGYYVSSNEWVGVQFNQPIPITKFRIYDGHYTNQDLYGYPYNFVFESSADNIIWTQLGSWTGQRFAPNPYPNMIEYTL